MCCTELAAKKYVLLAAPGSHRTCGDRREAHLELLLRGGVLFRERLRLRSNCMQRRLQLLYLVLQYAMQVSQQQREPTE